MINFIKNRSSALLRIRRLLHRLTDAESAPSFTILKDARPNDKWVLFFCYLPENEITYDHYHTIKNLRSKNYSLMIVAAATNPSVLEKRLSDLCELLIIKDLKGYDFSGYSIGIRHILKTSYNANILVLNDSVIGPIKDIFKLLEDSPWGLTGLTSCEIRENHIQSYAFMFKNINIDKFNKLSSVFPKNICYSRYMAVVRMQESRFARIAAKHMTVGSIWHSKDDMTVHDPLYLIEQGFPFLKKSLFSKFKGGLSEIDKNRIDNIYFDYNKLL